MPRGGSARPRQEDDDDFLGQLDCLNSVRNSARTNSSRHTWRSGLIPPCPDPPHRIPSHFPVPSGTLAQVPGLNHPDLSRGQRRYLYSTAQIYSMDSTKRALSNSYYGLLMSELMKGGGRRDSHKRYTDWIYGDHKRLFETNPAIWRRPKSGHRREETTTRDADGGGDKSSEQPRTSGGGRSAERRRDRSGTPVELPPQEKPLPPTPPPSPPPAPPPAQRSQPPQRRLQSASSTGRRSRGAPPAEDAEEEPVVVVEAGQPPRRRSAARGSARSRVSDASKARNVDEDAEDHGADAERPRDLSKIMY